MSRQVEFHIKHSYILLETIYESQANQTSFYKARDLEYDRLVGIKTIHWEDREQRNLLLREAKCMIQLESLTDRIPTLYEYHVDDRNQLLTLVMQFIEGYTLARVIKEDGDKRKDPYTIRKNMELMHQLSLVLGAIHRNHFSFQHKDLKPDNVIIKNRGQLDQTVYVIDFGITGRPMLRGTGTPHYQAPEQIGYLDYKTSDNVDVFALGLILFEVLTGKQLDMGIDFTRRRGEDQWASMPAVTDYNEMVPPEFVGVVNKCLQLSPNRRYRNGMEAANALKFALSKKGNRR